MPQPDQLQTPNASDAAKRCAATHLSHQFAIVPPLHTQVSS